MNFAKKIEDHRNQLQALEQAMMDPGIVSNQKKLAETSTEFARVKNIVDIGNEYLQSVDHLKSAEQALRETNDPEMRELAESEIDDLKEQIPVLEQQLQIAFIPPDPADTKDAVVEIRAGAGGDEAAIFAGDLFRMYSKFAESKGRKVEVANESTNDLGGMKEVIFEIVGTGAFGDMKFESGVHRVQRVPATEKQGRIHTSTATVAVFPKVEEQDFHLDMNDLKIEATTSTGAGGQSVNTTNSAIRITHIPTGIMVYSQQERSQHQNKAKALEIIRARVYAHEQEKKMKEESEKRLNQIGTGDRSEKIRTYNYPQDRITDHRIKTTWHNIPDAMDGAIEHIVTELKMADQAMQE